MRRVRAVLHKDNLNPIIVKLPEENPPDPVDLGGRVKALALDVSLVVTGAFRIGTDIPQHPDPRTDALLDTRVEDHIMLFHGDPWRVRVRPSR